jgi:CheY-like chemotaxis protein
VTGVQTCALPICELTVDSTAGQGSRFRVRLFLPQLHAAQAELMQPRVKRIGYVGVRRRILTVDNEAADRELLVHILEPLGFQIAQAASGEECLELAPRFSPHLIFMDLAMPGMDGWETLRRLRAGGLVDAEIAIISANAFEQGGDNDLGIAAEDFITKPVRVDDLLDWIGRRLGLDWVNAEAPPAPTPSATEPTPLHYPPALALRALDEQAELGYLRGIQKQLDSIETLDACHAEFVQVMRRLAAQFQFDAMREILRHGLTEDHPNGP